MSMESIRPSATMPSDARGSMAESTASSLRAFSWSIAMTRARGVRSAAEGAQRGEAPEVRAHQEGAGALGQRVEQPRRRARARRRARSGRRRRTPGRGWSRRKRGSGGSAPRASVAGPARATGSRASGGARRRRRRGSRRRSGTGSGAPAPRPSPRDARAMKRMRKGLPRSPRCTHSGCAGSPSGCPPRTGFTAPAARARAGSPCPWRRLGRRCGSPSGRRRCPGARGP